MYARGMTTRNISDTIMDIYGFDVSEGFISDVTDKLLPKITGMAVTSARRCISGSLHRRNSLRCKGRGRRTQEGCVYCSRHICERTQGRSWHLHWGENESAKYWLSILNELKNRGVKDILIVCADGLTGIKDAIEAAFPQTEYQRCIVHQVRNTLKYVSDKDRKAFANDLRRIYGRTQRRTRPWRALTEPLRNGSRNILTR